MKISLLVITILASIVLDFTAAIIYETYDLPFPECTGNASICDDITNYPHCVQCSPTLSLCSDDTDGCGCEIPDFMLRGNNQGRYLSHGEQFYTRIHCSQGSDSDHKVRNVYKCQNTELVLMRGFFAPCFEPNTTCIDTGLGEGLGGPVCVSGSAVVGTFHSQATLLITTATCAMMLLFM